jgi:hypothetical protein
VSLEDEKGTYSRNETGFLSVVEDSPAELEARTFLFGCWDPPFSLELRMCFVRPSESFAGADIDEIASQRAVLLEM